MSQRGFLLAGPLLYAAIAGGTLILTLGVALKWQSSRLETCHIDRATEKARYEAKLTEFDQKLAQQTQAIEELQERAATVALAGKAALEKARMEGRGLQAEAERLRAEMGKKPVSGCPAGDAVRLVRDGLLK